MAVHEPDQIDVMGLDKADGTLKLSISDHLDWTDSLSHQLTLQEFLARASEILNRSGFGFTYRVLQIVQ
jgi:hypothetical protein